jgi:hypothetical protein
MLTWNGSTLAVTGDLTYTGCSRTCPTAGSRRTSSLFDPASLPGSSAKGGVELTTAGPAEARRLRQRAQLILDLLMRQRQSPIPS